VKESTAAKLSVAGCAMILTAAVVLSYIVEPQYSVSLYWQVPLWIQIFAVGIITISSVGIVIATAHGNHRIGGWAVLPITWLFVLFGLLPYLLGYVTKYGDPISHVGYVRDILYTGQIPDVIYPGTHIFVAAVHFATELPATTAWGLIAPYSTVVFVATMAALARRLSVPVAPVALLSLFFAGTLAVPNKLVYMIFYAAIIYIGLGLTGEQITYTSRIRLGWVLGVILVGSVLIHPIGGLAGAGGLVSLIFLSTLRGRINLRGLDLPISTGGIIARYTIVFGLATFLWWTYTWLFKRAVRLVQILFFGRSGRDQFLGGGEITSALNSFGFSVTDIFVLGTKRYIEYMVLMPLAGCTILYLLFQKKRPDRVPSLPALFVILIIVAGVWSVGEFAIGIVPSISFHRALKVGGYVAAIPAAVGVLVILSEARCTGRKTHFAAIAIVAIVISGSLLVATASSYKSPYIVDKNPYVVESDIDGMNWYFEKKNQNISTTTLWRSNDRYIDLLLRPDERSGRLEELQYNVNTNDYRPPPHFGYQNSTTFGESIGCSYFIQGKLGRQTYLNVWDELYTYDPSEFNQLNVDPSINGIYTNGNVKIDIVGCRS
jgi:hypothetical protein